MGSGSKKPPKAPKVPAPPPPQNSYIYDGDMLVGENVYDPGSNSWTTRSYKTPEQIQAEKQYNDLRNRIMPLIGVTPPEQKKQLDDYANAFIANGTKPIKDTARQARSAAINNFNSRGVLGSTGSADYMNENIDKLEQEGLSQVANEAEMNKHGLKQSYDQGLLNQLAAAQGGTQQSFNNGMALGDMSSVLSTRGNSISSQNYQDKLNGVMSKFNAQMQSYNAQPRGGGIMPWLQAGASAAGAFFS